MLQNRKSRKSKDDGTETETKAAKSSEADQKAVKVKPESKASRAGDNASDALFSGLADNKVLQ